MRLMGDGCCCYFCGKQLELEDASSRLLVLLGLRAIDVYYIDHKVLLLGYRPFGLGKRDLADDQLFEWKICRFSAKQRVNKITLGVQKVQQGDSA